MAELAEEDALLGKPAWTVPAVNPDNAIPSWAKLSAKNKAALSHAYNAVQNYTRQSEDGGN